ncbi:MAG: alpha/beta hydrolase [Planctomycetales bacterium]|nr:alpha/beta hydrolase [Planctomycetales bacterium]
MRIRTLLLLLLVASLAIFGATALAQTDVVRTDGVVYRHVDERALHIDFCRPAGEGVFPCVVCIHGGGWQKGNYRDMRPVTELLAKNGFAAATIQYRLAPEHRFPAQIEDCRAAVRFLRTNAREFQIDADRIGVVGASAGGHLATLLGLSEDSDRFGDELVGQPSSAVCAVINFYGAMDFRAWRLSPAGEAACRVGFDGKDLNGVIADFLGTDDRQAPVMTQATAATYADSDDPPVLTFQGTADVLVPVAEARRFHQALLAAGVDSQLVEYPGANHGFGGEHLKQAAEKSLEFLTKHLK